MSIVAVGSLLMLAAEVMLNSPRILFGRYLWIDEMWTKLITSSPTFGQSLVTLKYSGDPTPPVYHIIARAFWLLSGASTEVAFRALSFIAMWLASMLTYATLRRTFAILPAVAAVLALWSCLAIIQYAFFARPYALLLAATAGLCLIYGGDNDSALAAASIAVLAALVCTLHYFGIFALAAIVLGDLLSRPLRPRAIVRRLTPAAAGPLALLACLPFVRAWTAGQTVFTYLPPVTPGSAALDIANLFEHALPATIVLALAWCVSALVWKGNREGIEPHDPSIQSVRSWRPIAGLSALLMVPPFVAIFSAFTHAATQNRYMIAGLLGLTPVLALIASKSSPRVLVVAVGVLAFLDLFQMKFFSAKEVRWQAAQSEMMTVGRGDTLPIVTFSFFESYLLYSYKPNLRPRLFIADLRSSHRDQLAPIVFNVDELALKWSVAKPDLPKVVTTAQLERMGKFHLLHSDIHILSKELADPSRTYTLDDIAQALSFRKVTDSIYEMPSN